MPPKVKKTKKKPISLPLDGVNVSEMSLKNLQDYCFRINEELKMEKGKTYFLRLERDKLRTYWDLAVEELRKVRSAIRTSDIFIEKEARHYLTKLKIFQQRVKNVYCEQNSEITRQKLLGISNSLVKENEYLNQGQEILNDINNFQTKITEMEMTHSNTMRTQQLEHAANVFDTRSCGERKILQLEIKFEKFTNDANESIENENESDLLTLTRRKQKEIENIVNKFKKQTHVLTHYYKNMIRHNMSVISNMKERFLAIEKHCESRTKHFHKLETTSRILKNSLNHVQEDVRILCEKLIDYEENKSKVRELKLSFPSVMLHYNNHQWEKDIALFRLVNLQNNNGTFTENMFNSNIKIVYDIERQQCLIESIIDILLLELKQKDLILLKHGSYNINDFMKATILKNINDTMAVEESLIYELKIVCEAHKKLICTYKDKLKSCSVHENEIGFVHLRIDDVHDSEGELILPKY